MANDIFEMVFGSDAIEPFLAVCGGSRGLKFLGPAEMGASLGGGRVGSAMYL